MPITSAKADIPEPAVVITSKGMTGGQGTDVPGKDAPVAKIDGQKLQTLGRQLANTFTTYRSDRRIQELRWLRNQRQYLGFYDPEIEDQLGKNRSRAYPKITRVKVIQMQSRIMDLMFPSDDRNWTLEARPSYDMDIADVKKAILAQQQKDADANGGQPPPLTKEYVQSAVQQLATQRAENATREIDDQLQELGGEQSYDYVQLNNEVVGSACLYGIGLLVGPYVRPVSWATWDWDETKQQPLRSKTTKYMPQFQFLSVWDFFPDMSAKRLEDMDGYFIRQIVSKKDLHEYAKQPDFFGKIIKAYLEQNQTGNYRPLEYETDLRTMGVKVNVNDLKPETSKFEILVWHGSIDGHMLAAAGIVVSEDELSGMIDAEVWVLDNWVIKCVMDPWVELGVDVRTLHFFILDKDDTAPIGFGLPNVMRDTQMSISAATRMMLDNASVVCGPIVEMNTTLLTGSQDLSALRAYKVFYRDDDGPTAQFPAIRPISVENHINDLKTIIDLFMNFADVETFVNPMNGGDTSKVPGEPMRNLAGASMLMGAASLPFKQTIRNYDNLTRSVILSLLQFNRKFNPKLIEVSDYDVIARGATSLIAKEVRGIQIDSFVNTMKPQEEMNVDWRKITKTRLGVRDMDNIMVPEEEVNRRQQIQQQADDLEKQLQQAGVEANTRNLLSQAFKNIAQGTKNQVGANAEAVNIALAVMEKGAQLGLSAQPGASTQPGGGTVAAPPAIPSGPVVPNGLGVPGGMQPPGPAQLGGMPPSGLPN